VVRAVVDPIEAVRLARPLLRQGGKVVVWISEWQAAQIEGQYEIVSYRLPESTMTNALLIAQ
jgi:hypothetical protein